MATKKNIDELEDILLSRKTRITNSILGSRNSMENLKDSECRDEYDFAEVSSDSFKEGLLADQQVKELVEIDLALKRIKEGSYGVCEMCDELINLGRLRAKPFAKFCIPCREIYENEKVNTNKKG